MENPNLLEEMIFANRNKAYGAYQLRHAYSNHLKKAVVLGILLLTFALLAPTIFANFVPKDIWHPVNLSKALDVAPPPKDEPIVPELPPPPPPVEQLKTIASLPPEIMIDTDVPDDVLVPKVSELNNAVISDRTQDGIDSDGTIGNIIDDLPAKTIEPVTIESTEPLESFTIEQQPEYPGGYKKLMEFLGHNIKYPRGAAASGVGGKVFLSFVVSKDGDIQKIQVSKGIGFGCDEEAMRVVGQMPRWTPGKQSGRAVPVRFTLPITFQLE